MSEADRVFSRMSTPVSQSIAENKELVHIPSRQRGAATGQSRMVEVVHRRSDPTASPTASLRQPGASAHAASWPEGFKARPAPSLMPAAISSATPALPVEHVMPGWTPLLPLIQPTQPAADRTTAVRRKPRVAKQDHPKDQPRSTRRAFADPFEASDTGTNCIRCGYLVSPAREKRGLQTCMQCR